MEHKKLSILILASSAWLCHFGSPAIGEDRLASPPVKRSLLNDSSSRRTSSTAYFLITQRTPVLDDRRESMEFLTQFGQRSDTDREIPKLKSRQIEVAQAQSGQQEGAGRARTPISRNVEGFFLGQDEKSVREAVRNYAHWEMPSRGKDFFAVAPEFSGKCGALMDYEYENGVQLLHFKLHSKLQKPDTTRGMGLSIYANRLYEINIEALAEDQVILTALREKYGTPKTEKRPYGTVYFWDDGVTHLRLTTISRYACLTYADVGEIKQIKEAHEEAKRRRREQAEREKKTLPRGY